MADPAHPAELCGKCRWDKAVSIERHGSPPKINFIRPCWTCSLLEEEEMLSLRLLTAIATFCRDISEKKPHPAAEASPSNTRWYQSSTQAQPGLDLKKKKKKGNSEPGRAEAAMS